MSCMSFCLYDSLMVFWDQFNLLSAIALVGIRVMCDWPNLIIRDYNLRLSQTAGSVTQYRANIQA